MNKHKKEKSSFLHTFEAAISYNITITEEELIKVLEPFYNTDLIKLMKLLFELPNESDSAVVKQLRAAKRLATKLDDQSFSDKAYEEVCDDVEAIRDKFDAFNNYGQGFTLYDGCRAELLYAFLDAIVCEETFRVLEDELDKWIDALKDHE